MIEEKKRTCGTRDQKDGGKRIEHVPNFSQREKRLKLSNEGEHQKGISDRQNRPIPNQKGDRTTKVGKGIPPLLMHGVAQREPVTRGYVLVKRNVVKRNVGPIQKAPGYAMTTAIFR